MYGQFSGASGVPIVLHVCQFMLCMDCESEIKIYYYYFYRGSLKSPRVLFLRFGRDIVLFTHIHSPDLLFYCVVFLHNQRRHPEVISLLTTTILSLSLNSLGCYQTNFIVCDAWSRKHFLTFAARSSQEGAATPAMFGQYERLVNVLSTN